MKRQRTIILVVVMLTMIVSTAIIAYAGTSTEKLKTYDGKTTAEAYLYGDFNLISKDSSFAYTSIDADSIEYYRAVFVGLFALDDGVIEDSITDSKESYAKLTLLARCDTFKSYHQITRTVNGEPLADRAILLVEE